MSNFMTEENQPTLEQEKDLTDGVGWKEMSISAEKCLD